MTISASLELHLSSEAYNDYPSEVRNMSKIAPAPQEQQKRVEFSMTKVSK